MALRKQTGVIVHPKSSHLPIQGLQVQSLVREQSSHMPLSQKKKKELGVQVSVAYTHDLTVGKGDP